MNSPPPDETCLSKAQRYLAQHKAEKEESDMTLNVKAGTPEKVHPFIPPRVGKKVVREIEEVEKSQKRDRERIRNLSLKRDDTFIEAMGEGFSTEETTRKNPLEYPLTPPAGKSTKTISETFADVTTQFKLMMVQLWLPTGYEVVESAPLLDVREFFSQACKLWETYEPLLGAQNSTTILQVDAPDIQPDDKETPEEEITRGNPT